MVYANSRAYATDPIGSYQLAWTNTAPATAWRTDLVLPGYFLQNFLRLRNDAGFWGLGGWTFKMHTRH